MGTRRLGDAMFDFGAQYFTARDPEFSALVAGWAESGLLRPWATGFPSDDGTLHGGGETRWMGMQGMTTVPRALADGLQVHLDAEVISVGWEPESGWTLRFRERATVHTPVLVLTIPVPQSLELLAAGGVALEPAVDETLGGISYDPCLTALIRLTGPSRIPEPGGLWLAGEPVRWIGDNTQKGISEDRLGASLTVHAGPEFSREWWDADPEETGARLVGHVAPWLGAEVAGVRIHRWRCAAPRVIHPERFFRTEIPGTLIFAGDAFGGGRVEAAALSGLAAGRSVVG